MGYKLGCKYKVNGRAVSPVIATILMVAVIVIISTSIAAVSLGFTDQIGDPTPTATFDFAHDGEDWIITHTHGDTLAADRLAVQITEPNGDISTDEWPNSGTVSSGESVRIKGYSGDVDLSILWENDDRSATLARSTGSSAGSGSGGNAFNPVDNIPDDGSGLYHDGDFEGDDEWDGDNLDSNLESRAAADKTGVYTKGNVDVAKIDVKASSLDEIFVYTVGDFTIEENLEFDADVHMYVGGDVNVETKDLNLDNAELILYEDENNKNYDGLGDEQSDRKDVEDWPDN